jgi:arginase
MYKINNKKVALIGCEFGFGAQIRETEIGPKIVKDSLSISKIDNWYKTIKPEFSAEEIKVSVGKKSLIYVEKINIELNKVVSEVLTKKLFPCVIGGDHSIAIGTWKALMKRYYKKGGMGLIWVDAHMDSHVYKTSPSKAYHGMPLATLLGFGEKNLLKIGSSKYKLDPKRVVLVGIRSYEKEEKELLEGLGVKIFYQEDIKNKGFKNIFDQAVSIVSKADSNFGISLDLDFFDPKVTPGVGSPEPNGTDLNEVIEVFKELGGNKLFRALEIVEYNPKRDIDDKTLEVIKTLLKTIFKN